MFITPRIKYMYVLAFLTAFGSEGEEVPAEHKHVSLNMKKKSPKGKSYKTIDLQLRCWVEDAFT